MESRLDGRNAQGQFQPGYPRPAGAGRKLGSLNKATQAFREFAKELLDSEEYRESLKQRMIEGKASRMEEVLLQHVVGKPKDTVEIQQGCSHQRYDLSKLTPQQIRQWMELCKLSAVEDQEATEA